MSNKITKQLNKYKPMKSIPIKQVSMRPGLPANSSTFDLLRAIIDESMPPPPAPQIISFSEQGERGALWNEIKKQMPIELWTRPTLVDGQPQGMKLTVNEISLEETDYKYLQKLVLQMQWAFSNESIRDFCQQFTAEK